MAKIKQFVTIKDHYTGEVLVYAPLSKTSLNRLMRSYRLAGFDPELVA